MYNASSSRTRASPATPLNNPSIRDGKYREPRAVSVKALHVEGKVKEGASSVVLSLFLLVSAPSQSPSHCYPLFPESNLVLRKSVVHPLNSQKVPFAFPQTTEHLLRRARKVLHLQLPLKESYGDAITNSQGPIASALMSPKRSALILGGSGGGRASPDAVGSSTTGEVVVRDFMVSLQMPKFILPSSPRLNGSPNRYGDDEGSSPFRNSRQTSFGVSTPYRPLNGEGERRDSFFIVTMELGVPLSGIPPNSPYMFILPLPRCLSNTIRLRMPSDPTLDENAQPTLESMTIPQVQAAPPQSDTQSQCSESPLESTLQPSLRGSMAQSHSSKRQVATRPHRRDSRASAEGYPADDELEGNSEDTGLDEGDPVIEGTFLSTDHLTVRWAFRPSQNHIPSVASHVGSRSNSVRSQSGRSASGVVSSRSRVTVDHVESTVRYTVFPIRLREIALSTGDMRNATIRMERLLPVAVEYTARCVGFSHPGVATGVALELALDERHEDGGVEWDEAPLQLANSRASSLEHIPNDWTFSSSAGIVDWAWAPSNRLTDGTPSSYGSRQSVKKTGSSDREASYGYNNALTREETLFSEGSPRPSGSRRPLSRQFESNGDSVMLERNFAGETSLMRAPLPSPALLDESFDDDGPNGRKSVSRESTGPSGLSSSQWSLTSSRRSRVAKSAASDSVGDLNGGQLSRTQTEIEFDPSSSSMPTLLSVGDLEPTPPSHPILLDVDLHAVLTSQKVPNPSMAQANFTFKGRILVSLPDSVDGADISAALPIFRLPLAREQECKVHILSAPILSTRELSRPFGVRFEGGRKEVIDPVVQGEAVHTVKVASSVMNEEVAPITLVLPLPSTKAHLNAASRLGSASITRGSHHGTAQASLAPPSETGGSKSLHFSSQRDIAPDGRNELKREPADELLMPSLFTSTPAPSPLDAKDEQDQQEPSTASTFRRPPPWSPEDLIIAWVDLTVIPVRGVAILQDQVHAKDVERDDDSEVKYINHLRATWPSHPSAPFAHRDLHFELIDGSNSVTGDDHVIVNSASAGERALHFTYQLSDSGSGWTRSVVITLPDEGLAKGEVLDIVYTVSRKGRPSRSTTKYDLLLPCFASTVARMSICVLCPLGHTFALLQSSIAHAIPGLNGFRVFSLPPHSSQHMSFKIKKLSAAVRILPSRGSVFRLILFVFTLAAAYWVSLVEEDMQGLRLQGYLPMRQPWHLPDLASVFPIAGSSSERVEEAPPTLPDVPATFELTPVTTTVTVTTTRRLPTQTYAAPDNLWGEWESTTVDPFGAEATAGSTLTEPEAETTSSTLSIWPFVEKLAGLDGEHRKKALHGMNHLVNKISNGVLAILSFTL
ncbi:hypothetical protein FRB96_006327 [Tulasnella sp. 330]|nr:hypothetical protein FRB96_006327 [Tulasnella sp. 330]